MIHLYSGEGKGKTSAAIGMAVRMSGAGKEIIFSQFMKGNESSELKVLEMLPQVSLLKVRESFGFYKDMTQEDKQRIKECHDKILKEILKRIQKHKEKDGEGTKQNGERDNIISLEPDLLVVLDEITYPCNWNLVDEGLLKQLLVEIPESVELVMTGRNPKDYMIQASDYWSEIGMKKHPYQKNVMARRGVEY